MRQFLLAVALVVGLHAAASAQVPGYPSGCPTCVVHMNVDWATHDVIAGWAFECTTGQTVDRIDVWYQTDAGAWVPAPFLPDRVSFVNEFTGVPIPRPDVAGYYAGAGCPAVTANAGFHYYFVEPLPPGARDIYVVTWRGGLLRGQLFRVE